MLSIHTGTLTFKLNPEHNIHNCLVIYMFGQHTPLHCTSGIPKKNIQPARRRELNRRPSTRQKSYCGLGGAMGRASSFFSSNLISVRGSTASAISFSPCTTNHSPSMASARASTHSLKTSLSSLRRFADEFSFLEMNDRRDVREHSSRYSNGGGSDSSDMSHPVSAETARFVHRHVTGLQKVGVCIA